MLAAKHQHHFEDLSPDDFERLVYWLVKHSGEFDEVQSYGGARDKGRDVVAYKHTTAGREKWYIQCKRYDKITFATLRDELDKLAEHSQANADFAPDVIVFATACAVPPQAKDQAAARAHELQLPEPYYWGRLELDEQLKAQPDTEGEFFLQVATPLDPSQWDAYLERYLEAVKARYGTIRIFGQPEPKPLEGIFTDLYILDKPAAWQRFDASQLQQDPLQPDTRRKRVNGLELVTQPTGHRLFILGKPGAGKTTFLRYLALQAAQGKIDRVPIFVSLKEWVDSGLELLPFIVHQFAICDFPDAQLFIEHTLREGQALVLFDALDEVTQADQDRLHVITALRDFCDQYRESQVLVTCRVAATEYQFEQFQYVEVADFDDDRMRVFVANWFGDDPAKGDRFWTEFAQPEHSGLRELGRTPLMLTLLCIVFDDLGGFPAKHSSFYSEALDALLSRWDKSRGIERDSIYCDLSPARKHQLLAYIAHLTFEQGSYYIPQATLEKHIADYLCALPDGPAREDIDTESILKAIAAQHGILVESAHRIYSFTHLTFQEYYAARYIVNNTEEGTIPRLLSHCTDDRWREVTLLTASLLDRADDFFAAFRRIVDTLIEDDEALEGFVRWAAEKAATVQVEYKPVAIRSYYCYLGLTLVHDPTHDIDFDHARARALKLTRDLDLDLVLNRPRDRAFVIVDFTGNRVLHRAIDRAFGLDPGFELDHILTSDLIYARDRAFPCPFGYTLPRTRPLDRALHRARDLGPGLHQALIALDIPDKEALPEIWQAFADDLQGVAIAHRDIGHKWGFTPEQYERLSDYFGANHLLVECLNVAYVSDHAAIEDSLLLPPET